MTAGGRLGGTRTASGRLRSSGSDTRRRLPPRCRCHSYASRSSRTSANLDASDAMDVLDDATPGREACRGRRAGRTSRRPRRLGRGIPRARARAEEPPSGILRGGPDGSAASNRFPSPRSGVQNVHAMRPEVRADYERALEHVDGDAAFARALRALLRRAARPARRALRRRPALPGAVAALLDAIARAAAARDPELRRLDHEREITADWLQREQAVGYVTYVDRFAGTLRGRPRAAPLPARARRQLPAPDAAAARAAGSPTTAATRSPTTARSSPRWARWTTCARWPPTCAPPGWRCASTSSSTTPRASTRGRRRRWPATRASSPTTARSPTAREPDAYERDAARRLPGHRARQLHLGPGARALGVDDVQRLPVGPRLHEPRGLPRHGRGHARARRRRRRRPAPRRRAVPVEADRHELPEPARGARAPAGASAR